MQTLLVIWELTLRSSFVCVFPSCKDARGQAASSAVSLPWKMQNGPEIPEQVDSEGVSHFKPLGCGNSSCTATELSRHSTMITRLSWAQTPADKAFFVLCPAKVSTRLNISGTSRLQCCFFLGPHCFREGGEGNTQQTWVILEKCQAGETPSRRNKKKTQHQWKGKEELTPWNLAFTIGFVFNQSLLIFRIQVFSLVLNTEAKKSHPKI